ncbi:MAG: hypothetical protein MRZ79_23765 [Bacteroidia bacterium]|nr:hypothetical protein [Bacteroidia bacterium]
MNSKILGIFCLFLLSLPALFGQSNVQSFDPDPAVFINQFGEELSKNGMEPGANTALRLKSKWEDGQISDQEKKAFITLINSMVGKKYRTDKGLLPVTNLYLSFKDSVKRLELEPMSFLLVGNQSVNELQPARALKFFSVLGSYQRTGFPVKGKSFYWDFSQNNPKLSFETIKTEEESYKSPVLEYQLTDLYYFTNKYNDSTLIEESSGKFYPLSMTFIGNGGQVSWEKVGLPAENVYANLNDYNLNLNHGLVKIDSVDFFYHGLITGPLKGKFEDRNAGYKTRRSANYPYFKSYKGGVVIENLLPNIRYQGGFSLKGMRRIGTSYDIPKVKEKETESEAITGKILIEDEKKDDEWNDSGSDWGDWEDNNSSFETDDDYDDTDDTWVSSSDEGAFGGWGDLPEETEHIPAQMEIQRKGNTVMKLAGEAFVLDDERMVGKAVEAILYTSDADSLYHPSMDAIYLTEDTTVTLKKPKRSVYARIPFTSSYHEYFLYFESIRWNLTQDQLEFTAFVDKENKVSAIESYDYFTKARYNKYKGVLRFNPIGALYQYSIKNKGEPIFPESLTKEFRIPEANTAFERSLPQLEGDGFLKYDRLSKEITPLPKLYAWGRAARKKKDFDAIQIISKVDTGSHAKLNLDNMELTLQGVPYFSISDSVFLWAKPSKQEVVVEQNRNLRFGGQIAAGRLNFYGNDTLENYHFDYESYSILVDSVDSIRFVMNRNPDPNVKQNPLEKALNNTVFEGVTGAIHIDHPYNKSGEKDYSHFPVFDSYSQSYLYWASNEVEGGVYSKEKMYFAVDPFVLDSLETFDPTNLQFDGEFYSSEIFPVIKQRLQVMDDFTLGFKRATPPEGYEIYNGNGKIMGDILLDSKGLHAGGTLEYLGTIAKSDTFVFHFDSVMATVNYFNMKKGYRKGVYFPEVKAATAEYKWKTKDSTLLIKSKSFNSLSLFDGEATFSGELKISELGMVGNGTIELGQVQIDADSIVFSQMDFTADNSTFTITDENDSSIIMFQAQNVNVAYDVKEHSSDFKSKEDSRLLADFPLHKYKTNLVKGNYGRDTYDLRLEDSGGLGDSTNYFISTLQAMDSLKFMAGSAYYDLFNKTVRIDGVEQILIADAVIFPDSAYAVVEEGGYLKPLQNAVISADQDSGFHRIYDAIVQVNSREDYTGSGKYDYIEVDGQKQFIEFNDIRVNSDQTTVASGEIAEEDEFYLTERIFFAGDAFLDASRKFLEFEGEVKIESENEAFYGVWFDFDRTLVNPDSVFIPIAEDIANDVGDPLISGLNYYPEMRSFYSSFLQPTENIDDKVVLTASGGLTFDRKKKEFKIGSREKILGKVYKGATVAFNDEAQTITSKGFLKFPYNFEDKTVSIKMAGEWKENLKKRTLNTDLVMGINMGVLPDEALSKLVDAIAYATATQNKDIDFNQRSFLESAAELLDEENKIERETQKLVQNVSNSMVYTDIKMAEQLPYTLLLSGVNFNYDRRLRTLYSDAELGLIGINGRPINKVVRGKVVYKFGKVTAEGDSEPDKLTIYLQADEFNWVYFSFEDQIIYTVSSYYDEYNAIIQQEFEKLKTKEGFHFELEDNDRVAEFNQEFIKKYIKN